MASCSASVLLLTLASPAFAQAGATQAERNQPVSTSAGAPDDIVVTARKREERALDVPIALSAVTGETLERRGADNLADFLQEAPGVGIYDQGNGQQKITIRGISTSLGANENGYYLDDLPFTGVTVPISPDVRAWDLDRVEVLRGPQGTLFGEGSMGGTVRILTKGADLNEWEAKGTSFLSSTEDGGTNRGIKGAFNAPIIPGVLAVRVAGTAEHFDGWIDNPTAGTSNVNKQDFTTFRAKARFDPTDRLSITGSYWKYRADLPGGNNQATDEGNQSLALTLGASTRYELYGATARYDFGGAALFYGYAHNSFDSIQSGTYLGGTITAPIGIDVDSHEVRLSSNGSGRLQWTIGGYLRNALRQDATVFALFGLDSRDRTKSDAKAVFGEATYELPSLNVDLTAGLRYYEEKRSGTEFTGTVGTAKPEDTYMSWNPRFSVAWHPSDRSTIYASAAKGFRPGQLQPLTAVALAGISGITLPATLKQDYLWTYEVGAKADLFDRLLTVEGAVYYTDWNDVTVRFPIGTTGFNGLINSNGTHTKGVELSAVVRPFRGLSLSASGAYNDAEYTGAVAGTGIVDGTPVDDVAKFTANASADYRTNISEAVAAFGRVGWQHSSPRTNQTFSIYRAGDTIDLVDARIGFDLANLSIAAFVDNLTNERGALSFRTVTPLTATLNDIIAVRTRPRTIGLELTARFGGSVR
ncbi:TonB-dependent receptor plug domain-containing protein [Sphingomonas carotinifaciens]|nr:TonB-dependent receptor plug domain-containing protein [Sphingomonas carotinifaciens]